MNNPDFQVFWGRYGKKRERSDAERAWQRLTDEEQQAAVDGLAAYHKRCLQQGTEQPYPAAYLNQRLWQKAKLRRGRPPKSTVPAGPRKDPFEEMEMW